MVEEQNGPGPGCDSARIGGEPEAYVRKCCCVGSDVGSDGGVSDVESEPFEFFLFL